MGKIIARDVRVVSFTRDDVKTVGRTMHGLDREQIDACATAVAAARNAHVMCGPGLKALTAMMAGVPEALATAWAKQHLKSPSRRNVS
ncbi:hypothetical protein [Sphingomonas sp. R86521]|uniref:hypothetical protein n=1 Tax=Sphingomonas sp. R86521 TaxID=3093860 RepID=UPI0036D41BE3